MNSPARNSKQRAASHLSPTTPTQTAGADKLNSIVTRSPAFTEPERRQFMIAEAAYYCSEHRGFDPDHELDDWLAAESQVDAALALGETPTFGGG